MHIKIRNKNTTKQKTKTDTNSCTLTHTLFLVENSQSLCRIGIRNEHQEIVLVPEASLLLIA